MWFDEDQFYFPTPGTFIQRASFLLNTLRFFPMPRPAKLREPTLDSEAKIRADDADKRVARDLRMSVGRHLQKMYGGLLNEPLPPKITDLLRRLD
jgi:hypothetical protein